MIPLFLAVILGQSPMVDLPKDLNVKAGRLLKIESKSAGKTVRWVNTSEDADLIVSESGRWAIFSSTVPGVYKIFAFTAQADVPSEASICTIVVGGGIPPSPIPEPNSLKATLQAIYGADGDPKKSEYKAVLTALYGELAKACTDDSLKIVGDFYSLAKRSSNSVLPETALQSLREKIATELEKVLPTDPIVPLTPDLRSSMAKKFAELSTLIGGLQ